MQTLLFRLAGPMQSWGTQSRFSVRDTGLEPSKSGVIGLLCAALGLPRNDTDAVRRLAALKMGIRADREGAMLKDFHTALNVAKAGGGIKPAETSDRYYLADADFLVGFQSDDIGFLQDLDAALAEPRWPLFLGRKSFVPSQPLRLQDGLRVNTLDQALANYPWQKDWRHEPPKQLRIVLDARPEAASQVRQDVPLSFAERRFTIRYVRTEYIPLPKGGE